MTKAAITQSGKDPDEINRKRTDNMIEIDTSHVAWLVVRDNQILHEAETKREAQEEAGEEDRIVAKLPMEPPVRL